MNYSKQIRELKKQFKPISKIKGINRGIAVLNNAKITRKIYQLQKKYGHGVVNHEYFKQIKRILNTKSSSATVNKVKQLSANNNRTNSQVKDKVQKQIDSAVKNYMNNYKNTSANTGISATNQDCFNLGKQVIKLICLKHPTTKLSIKDIRTEMNVSLDKATKALREADATVTNKPKGEPPVTPNYNQDNTDNR